MSKRLSASAFALVLLVSSINVAAPITQCVGMDEIAVAHAAVATSTSAMPSTTRTAARAAKAGSVVGIDSGKGIRRALAEGVSAAALDDEIPGVAAPPSPIVDTVDDTSDFDDVYQLALVAGQILAVSLTGPAGTDFDAYLYPPGSTSVSTDEPVAGATGQEYPDEFAYVVPTSGTYYLDAHSYAGSGTYALAYSVSTAALDDEIPGVPAPPSPIADTLGGILDYDDVYQLDLVAGQVLSVSLTGAADTDFDLYLFAPGSVSVFVDDSVAWASGSEYPDEFAFDVPVSGTYYLDVTAFAGSGSYSLTYSTVTPPEPTTIDLEHNAAGVVFDRFVTGYSTSYSGGGYVYGRWAWTELTATFTGSSIRWVGPKQPSYGMADVYIDGSIVTWNVDCYAPDAEKTLSATIWESEALSDGPHTITIRLSGQKNVASTGYVVVLDKFEVTGVAPSGLGTRIDDSTATPGYTGTWLPYINPTYFNTTYAYSRWTNAAFTVNFTGTRVAWIGPRTPNYGIADVYIDGVKVATVDCYVAELASQGWREVVWQSEALPAGAHTLVIRPTGTKHASATAANVVIDAIDVTE